MQPSETSSQQTSGRAWTFTHNIDTDQIIAARYLVTADEKELASHCLEDTSPAFTAEVKPGDLIVAGRNFGCGSSREHAPLAIKGAGVKAVIAASFARIFFRNAINLGLPLLECAEAVDGIQEGDDICIDLEHGTIRNITRGSEWQATPLPEFAQSIMNAGGLMSMVAAKLGLQERKNTATETTKR